MGGALLLPRRPSAHLDSFGAAELVWAMNETVDRKRLGILAILAGAGRPLGSEEIRDILVDKGFEANDRTVRFHLLELDKLGLSSYKKKHGRIITEKGRAELARARVHEKVGFLSARIDRLTYSMSFDLASRTGAVIVNVSLIEKRQLARACPLMQRVFKAGYAMGSLITLFAEGERVHDSAVPPGCVGIGTVCSITLNGVLLAHGIPVRSRFGGLLEVENRVPTRFVAIISYDGTSIDPLEIFIKGGMTDYLGATSTGTGLLGASFREAPDASREEIVRIAREADQAGLGGFLEIGLPGRELYGIPVSEGLIGAVVVGGLNPVAILEESGIPVESKALSGLVEYSRLFPYTELKARARAYL